VAYLPSSTRAAQRVEVIEMRATIEPPMETGFRPGDGGRCYRATSFSAFMPLQRRGGVRAELFSAMAVTPTSFFVRAGQRTLVLRWDGVSSRRVKAWR
jgi:hypothetical protein